MMRIIPKKTRVSLELFKGISIADFCVAAIGITLAALVLCSNLPYKLYIITGIIIVFVLLLISVDEDKNYVFLGYIIRHYSRPSKVISQYKIDEKFIGNEDDQWEGENEEDKVKKHKEPKSRFSVPDLIAFTDIKEDMIHYGGKYYSMVIEVSPVEFRFMTESKQDFMIDRVFGAALRNVTESQSLSIVKIDRPIIYDEYIERENKKIDDISEAFINGVIEEDELRARLDIICDRIENIERINYDEKIYDCFHYICVFDSSPSGVRELISAISEQMSQGGIRVKLLNSKELAVFLKYNFFN